MKIRRLCNRIPMLLMLSLLSGLGVAATPEAGQVIGRNIFGLATDVNGDPLLAGDRAYIHEADPQHETLELDGERFLVSVFDETIGGVYLSRLAAAGQSALDSWPLDLSASGGLTGPRLAATTEWNTLLLLESSAVDAGNMGDFVTAFSPYYKNNRELINPYHYGWLAEVILLDSQGQAKLIKNFAPGRLAATAMLIMPDNRTFYFLDALGHVYLFVADETGSLANGVLYAIDRRDGRIRHLLLGKGSALRLKLKLNRMTFGELFDSVEAAADGCPAGFTPVSTSFADECLRIKKKNRRYAGLFEPRRVAAMRGVGPLVGQATRLAYDTATGQLIFLDEEKETGRFPVGADDKLNSQFVLR